MTESMKFGPEWLRNLSQDGSTGSAGGGPRTYQLAEHRYGREEMLALFDRNLGPPEILGRFKSLYVDRLQPPLALAPTAEEENRMWQARPAPGGVGSVRGSGRGGSVDRGGRGRGVTRGYHNTAYAPRSQSGYDEDVGIRINARGGGVINQGDRSWSDRNGDTDWNGGSTSPRKEFSASGRASMDNWRRHRAGEDDDGWRTQGAERRPEKWVRSASWRDGEADGAGDREINRNFDRVERDLRDRGDRGARAGAPWTPRKPWEMDDILPEWAMENPSESGGTFDASGAFHGSDDEHDHSNPKLIHSQSTNTMRSQSPRPAPLSRSQTQGSISIRKHQEDNQRSREDPLTYSERDRTLEKSSSSVNISAKSTHHKTLDTSTYNHTNTDSNSFHTANSVPNLSDAQSPDSDATTPTKPAPPLHNSTPRKLPDIAVDKPTATNHSQSYEVHKLDLSQSEMFVNNSDDNSRGDLNTNNQLKTSVNSTQKTMSGTERQNEIVPNSPPDEFARMQEVADDIVAQLMLDEDKPPVISDLYDNVIGGLPGGAGNRPTGPSLGTSSLGLNQSLVAPPSNEKWYYRDPQGEVQGPFLATEMTEWHRAGYFTNLLLLRRTCDERYTTLGDLIKMCGDIVPFLASSRLPPLKAEQQVPPTSQTDMHQYQIQQMQIMQRQLMIRKQQQLILKLTHTDHWRSLNPHEQSALLMQQMAQFGPLPEIPVAAGVPAIPNPSIGAPHTQSVNPLMQLIAQMHQSKSLPQVPPIIDNFLKHTTNHHHQQQTPQNHLNPQQQSTHSTHPVSSINHTPNHMNKMSNIIPSHPISQSHANPGFNSLESVEKSDNLDPIQSLLRQLSGQHSGSSNSEPGWTAGNWGGNPTSMWDMQGPKPEMKTEQQIIEEQMRLHQEDEAAQQRDAELKQVLRLRKAEIEAREAAEARALEVAMEKARKQAEQEEKLQQLKDAEDKRKEEQRKIETEKKKQEEKEKKEAEKIKKELDKVKKEAEEKRLRELEEKRRQKELRKQEEERRKDEDARKKIEDEEASMREEEARIHEENKRRQVEALKKLQDQQQRAANAKAAPWKGPSGSGGPSLIEIQRLEKEKRAEQLKEQQAVAAAREQQAAMLKEQEITAANERAAMQLKWAEQKPQVSNKIKSLAEIQAEEQRELAKQAAAERVAAQQRERDNVVAQQAQGIWTSAPSLNWTSTAWTSNTGFWDDTPAPLTPAQPAQIKSQKTPNKQLVKSPTVNSIANHSTSTKQHNATTSKPVAAMTKQQNNNLQKIVGKSVNYNNNVSKKYNKKDEKEDFTAWCTKAMSSINSSVDVPTFIGFLNDIESPYEVKDYIRTYLGDSKDAVEFARQFLERRSRFKNQQRAALAHTDDMCSPAPAVNPSNEFQEVKGKGKKPKKNKMLKVDNRILGFNVTAAQDRINIGDRDYGDGN